MGNNRRWVEVLVQLNTTSHDTLTVSSVFYLDAAVCAAKTEEKVSHCRECTKIRLKQKADRKSNWDQTSNNLQQEEIDSNYLLEVGTFPNKSSSEHSI